MSRENFVLLKELLRDTKDGDWGQAEPSDDHVEVHVIRGTDFPRVRTGNNITVPVRFFSKRTAHRRILEPNDILIETAGGSRDRPTGRTMLVTEEILARLPGKASCASFARFLRVDPSKADPRYIYWYLQNLYNSGAMWRHQVQHTGVARFQYTRFAETEEIALPPFYTQRAVSDMLCALDDKIAVNERIAATAREINEAEFEYVLGQDETETVLLREIASKITRGIAPKYSDSDDDLIVLNQKCIRDGRVNMAPARRTLREKASPVKRLNRHDVLINSTGVGTLGRVALWTRTEEATVDTHITIVRFDQDKVDQVCAGFSVLRAQRNIEALGQGSTGQTELRRVQLENLEVSLPTISHRPALRAKLDALEERGGAAIRESCTLAELRDTLLPQLMSGKLRVRDAERIVESST